MKKEFVWVVSSELIEKKIGKINKFKIFKFNDLTEIFEKAIFINREEAEKNEKYKQIIPYTVFINKEKEVLMVKRTKNQSEKRLHEKLSVGIGGHINPEDKGPTAEMTFFNALNRENNEELHIENLNKLEYIGLIYNDSNEVSRVHIGIMFRAFVDNAEIKEKENFIGSWINHKNLNEEEKEKMEEWSKIALKYVGV
jgi:predicted NUDIX family phosphoesterase